jgi:hypothetical protein
MNVIPESAIGHSRTLVPEALCEAKAAGTRVAFSYHRSQNVHAIRLYTPADNSLRCQHRNHSTSCLSDISFVARYKRFLPIQWHLVFSLDDRT